jgi:hypothetical protein
MIRLVVLPIFILQLCSHLFAQGGGSALRFDGSDDIVICGADSSLNIQEMLTIEAWIKGSLSQSTYARIVDKFEFFQHQGFSLVRYPELNSCMLDFYATDDTKHTHGGTTSTFDEKWHYVAATFDSINIKIYIDGRLEAHAVLPGKKSIQLCPKYLSIGNGFDGATWFPYSGIIDEVRLWNTSLDSVTIKNWMHKTLSPDHPGSSNLVGYWKFDEDEGSVAGDSSGTQNHGMLTNMDTTSSWINSTVPIAGSFASQLDDVSAVWTSVDSNFSTIFSINDTNITGDACIIFGHNGEDLTWNSTDIPENFDILYRINRVWHAEVYDTISGYAIFDVSDLDISDGNGLKLLIDADGIFSDADTAHGIYDSTQELFIVSNQNFQHGYHYTLGTEEQLVSHICNPPLILPQQLILTQNYPNPFNPESQFTYSLPFAGPVEISLYNVRGQKVKTLFKGYNSSGTHSMKITGTHLSSGVYIYELKTSIYTIRKKCILLR